MILFKLFIAFLQIGLFSIGGGYAAIPLIQAKAVDYYGWISEAEFADLITIAEMTPGPIAVNSATFVGMKVGGLLGAIVSTLGCILPSMIIVSILFFLYRKYKGLPLLDSVMDSLRAVVVALILSAGLSLLKTAVIEDKTDAELIVDVVQVLLFVVSFLILRIKKVSPILVMFMAGAAGLISNMVINAVTTGMS
ncbi:MAG: chromate transporter [Lachnospiraceae bacterium]|nr:chromate transporter [Lachnospiraceae bacterium]